MKLPDTISMEPFQQYLAEKIPKDGKHRYKRCGSPILFQVDQGLLEGPIISRQNLQILCQERAPQVPRFIQPRPE